MTDRDIMKKALDALLQSATKAPFGADGVVYVEGVKIHKAAIAALTERLAQPEQEPVAWMYQCTAGNSEPVLLRKKQKWAEDGTGLWVETPLFTSSPQRKPLTDVELADLTLLWYKQSTDWMEFARAIEAAHGIGEKPDAA